MMENVLFFFFQKNTNGGQSIRKEWEGVCLAGGLAGINTANYINIFLSQAKVAVVHGLPCFIVLRDWNHKTSPTSEI